MTVISGTISECHMSQYAGVGIVLIISRAGVGIVRISRAGVGIVSISRAGVGIATISREDIVTNSVLINRLYI